MVVIGLRPAEGEHGVGSDFEHFSLPERFGEAFARHRVLRVVRSRARRQEESGRIARAERAIWRRHGLADDGEGGHGHGFAVHRPPIGPEGAIDLDDVVGRHRGLDIESVVATVGCVGEAVEEEVVVEIRRDGIELDVEGNGRIERVHRLDGADAAERFGRVAAVHMVVACLGARRRVARDDDRLHRRRRRLINFRFLGLVGEDWEGTTVDQRRWRGRRLVIDDVKDGAARRAEPERYVVTEAVGALETIGRRRLRMSDSG